MIPLYMEPVDLDTGTGVMLSGHLLRHIPSALDCVTLPEHITYFYALTCYISLMNIIFSTAVLLSENKTFFDNCIVLIALVAE